MPRIVLDKIEKSFGDVRVLHPLELDFADGEFTVLVGPSGCGKSTTLRILAGLESASGGEIYFDDRPITALEPKDRDIAMVFQDYALYPHMSIARNMSFALRLARTPKAEIDTKVQRVAEMLNIAHLLGRKPAELSGGQRQRVAMGRVMVRDAGTFLFDEPLSNLDAKLRARMRTELAGMRERLDKNMIYVTHDQIEAMTLGDRIVVMADGVVQQQGTPQELFEAPVNKFVAGFIGTPTMNFLDGELVQQDNTLWVRGAGYLLPLSPETASRLNGHGAGAAKVTAGIRPSAFLTDPASGAPIELKLVVSEYLGTQSVLVTHCADTEVQVEINGPAHARPGETMTFGVQPQDIRLFDAETGKTL
ncbi:MAG: ABC transporter ATP-binding protein [Pseudomonadota bacterium]